MPFKRPASPYWYTWPQVPGYGRVGPWSTGTKDRGKASVIEGMLKDLPLRGHGDVLRLLLDGQADLREVYVFHLEGRLAELVERSQDPRAQGPIDELLAQVKDDRIRTGLANLARLLPAGARLSHLRSPKNIEAILHQREREGIRRNSVRRSLYRAISDLLDRELGHAEKTRIMAEVKFPAEKDERTVKLRPEQVAGLLDAAVDPLFECFLAVAMLTGIDRGPLLSVRPRHFAEASGELEVRDRKTDARPRTLELSAPAARYLRRAIQLRGAHPDERVFPWTIGQVRASFEAAAERAGLRTPRRTKGTGRPIDPEKVVELRLKDLRSVFADAFVQAGGTLKDLQAWLGHADGKTALRYTRSQAVRQRDVAEKAADVLGFGGRHLKVAEETA